MVSQEEEDARKYMSSDRPGTSLSASLGRGSGVVVQHEVHEIG